MKYLSLLSTLLLLLANQACAKTCPSGEYWDLFQCKPCPAGTFLDGNLCQPCAAGTFAFKLRSLSCEPCPQGEYQPNAGQGSCLKCPEGTVSRVVGATSSDVCTYSEDGNGKQPRDVEADRDVGQSAYFNVTSTNHHNSPENSKIELKMKTRSLASRCGPGTFIKSILWEQEDVVFRTYNFSFNPLIIKTRPVKTHPGQTCRVAFNLGNQPSPQTCKEEALKESRCTGNQFGYSEQYTNCRCCKAINEFNCMTEENFYGENTNWDIYRYKNTPNVKGECCEKCPRGTASNETGATSSDVCQPCKKGEFQPNSGQASCLKCPFPLENLEGASEELHCSLCQKDYYLKETVELSTLRMTPQEYCKKCPEESTDCDVGTILSNITVQAGYWRASKNTSEVHKCNFPNICNSTTSSLLPSPLSSDTTTLTLQPSYAPSSSVSAVTGDYCAKGYYGALCEACISSNEYFDKVNGVCKECKSSRFFIHLAIITALILPIVSILFCVRSHLTPISITIVSLSVQAKIKVLIGFYQIMSSFTDIYGVRLHQQIRKPFRFMTYIFSFEFLSSYPLDCLNSESLAYIVSGLWPYFICISIGICYQILKIFRKYFKRCCIDALLENVTFTQIATVVLYLPLPIASKHIFDAKICQAFTINDAQDDVVSYLLSSRTIKCNSDDEKYQNLQILFWIFFALWPCLTLLGFAAIVMKILPSIRAGRPSDFAMSCQFIWRDFDPNSNLSVFWDIIDFVRKIFLMGFINFIDQNEGSRKVLRLTIGTAVSIVFLLILLYVRPYKRNDDFQLSVLSSFLISLCFGLSYIIQICDNVDGNTCEMFVGLKDSLGASILVTLLVLGMLIVTILVLVFQSKLSPIARLQSTKYPPDLTLPEDCTHHVFMSHKWKGGQDKCHSIARKLQLYMPGLKVWLDVDNLSNTTDLEDHVEKSVVFLLFYSPGYFKRRNCRREFFQAISLEKPIVVVYDGDNSQLTLMKNECKTVYKKTDEMYELMEKCDGIPRSEWENKVNHLKGEIGIFISEQFGCDDIDGMKDESGALAIQWLKTGSYSSESLKLIYLRILKKLPCYAGNIEAPMLSKGLHLPADKKTPPIRFNFELCFSSYNDGAGEIASELQKMQSRSMSVIDLTTTKLSIDEENAIDSNPNEVSSQHASEIKNVHVSAQDPEFSHNEENAHEAFSLLTLESNGLIKQPSDNDSLPSCFSLEASVIKGKEEYVENEMSSFLHDPENSEREEEENEMSALLLDPDISTSTLAADLETVKQLESPTFKVFLLYLNKDTFSSANMNSFGPILKSVLLKNIPVIVVHEQDVKKGGRPNFDFFLDHTPSEFMSAYQDIAIPIYSLREYRDVSLCCTLERIIEKYKRSKN